MANIPVMSTAQSLASLYGINNNLATQQSNASNAVNSGYDVQRKTFKESSDAYYDNIKAMASSIMDALRKANVGAEATGASRGVAAANQLSALLALSGDTSAGALELANKGVDMGDQYKADLATALQAAFDNNNATNVTLGQMAGDQYATDTQAYAAELAAQQAADQSAAELATQERIAQMQNDTARLAYTPATDTYTPATNTSGGSAVQQAIADALSNAGYNAPAASPAAYVPAQQAVAPVAAPVQKAAAIIPTIVATPTKFVPATNPNGIGNFTAILADAQNKKDESNWVADILPSLKQSFMNDISKVVVPVKNIFTPKSTTLAAAVAKKAAAALAAIAANRASGTPAVSLADKVRASNNAKQDLSAGAGAYDRATPISYSPVRGNNDGGSRDLSAGASSTDKAVVIKPRVGDLSAGAGAYDNAVAIH